MNCQKAIQFPMKKLILFSKTKKSEEKPKTGEIKQNQEPKKKPVEDSKKDQVKQFRELFWDDYSDIGYC